MANFGGLGPLLAAANPSRFRVVSTNATLAYGVRSTSYAIYGQATYHLGADGASSPLAVSLGLRYTWDDKSISRTQNGAAPFTGDDRALNENSARFSKPTGDLTLRYRAIEDVNLYARVARGYRSGGFNSRQTTNAAANLGLIPFKPETIWSYEVGAKTQLFSRIRLNGSVFYNQYNDLIVAVPIPSGVGATFGNQLINAGKTDYYGAELEGRVEATDHIFFDASFGYVHKNSQAVSLCGCQRPESEYSRHFGVELCTDIHC